MMGLGWLIIMVLVGLVVWAIIGSSSGRRRRGAMDLLDERLARGELSPEDYRERRNILEDVHR
jgi:putative membrane protein